MSTVKGTFRNGQVVLDEAADWPDGSRVVVEPVVEVATVGIREEDWPETPDGIARHLALMDQIEPLELTPEEEADWQAARQAQKEYEKAKFENRSRRIEDMFQ